VVNQSRGPAEPDRSAIVANLNPLLRLFTIMDGSIQPPDAWHDWETIVSESIVPADGSNKRFLGSRDERRCIFCDRDRNSTSFRDDAHVIPAAFGNRTLFTYAECDDCNQTPGSQLEDDLAKFMSLPRVMTRFAGRKGTPKLRRKGHTSYLKANLQSNSVYIHQPDETEDSVNFVDNEDGSFTLNVKVPKHRTANVARALGRMALFLLPTDFEYFNSLRSWVMRDRDWFPIPLTAFHAPGCETKQTTIAVERYRPMRGRCILRVSFRYSSYFLFMPIPVDNWELPAGVPMLNLSGVPLHIRVAVLQNVSEFLIPDNEPDETGISSVCVTYGDRETTLHGKEKAEP